MRSIAPALAALLLALPSGADVLRLEQTCTGRDLRCFTTLDGVLAELNDPRISGRAVPGPSNPVTVQIGPGTFSLGSTEHPYCRGFSNISFKGAGTSVTTLTGGGYAGMTQTACYGAPFDPYEPYAVYIDDCTKIDFADLTIRAELPQQTAVRFEGDGSTRWENVVIEAPRVGWYDVHASSPTASVHHWYSVNVSAPNSALVFDGSTHWIFGSSIESIGRNYATIAGWGNFDAHIYGSNITTKGAGGRIGLYSYADATQICDCSQASYSVEGSAIVAISSEAGATGIFMGAGCGKASVQGSKFRVEAKTTARRIAGNVDSPYALGSGANPPAVAALWSAKGQDTFIETDCSATQCNDATGPALGTDSHLLSFDAACNTAGRWFDTTTRKCRGVP